MIPRNSCFIRRIFQQSTYHVIRHWFVGFPMLGKPVHGGTIVAPVDAPLISEEIVRENFESNEKNNVPILHKL